MSGRGRPEIGKRYELRLPTDLAARVDAFADANNMKRPAAMRQLLEHGLDAVQGANDSDSDASDDDDADKVRRQIDIWCDKNFMEIPPELREPTMEKLQAWCDRWNVDPELILSASPRQRECDHIDDALIDAIITTYHRIARMPHSFVSLEDLRAELPEISRFQLDNALAALFADGRIRLTEECNRKTITPSYAAAAIRGIGKPRHLMQIG